MGENAVKTLCDGGGSSTLKVKYEVSPLQGIRTWAGRQVEVNYVAGYASSKEANALQLRMEAAQAAEQADIVLFVEGSIRIGIKMRKVQTGKRLICHISKMS